MVDNIEIINSRIDSMILAGKKLENIVIAMAIILFVTGLSVLIYGIYSEQSIAIGSGTLMDIMIIWPINRLTKMREKNILLGVMPSLATTVNDSVIQAEILKKLIEDYNKK
jgi:hypothetical protein